MTSPAASKVARGGVGSRELKAHEQGLEAVLDALEMEGALSKGSGEPLPDVKPLVLRGESVAKTIARDRNDRS